MGTALHTAKPEAAASNRHAARDIFFVVKQLRSQWPDIDQLTADDINRMSPRFRGGINNWVVQTYLQLREPLADAGIHAHITDRFVADAINVAHRDHLNTFSDFCEKGYVVAIRADRPPVAIGRRQIVQNVLAGRATTERYLPLWPQPGLIPRNPARGWRIEHIAYFGRDQSMTYWLRDPAFAAALRRSGVTFSPRVQAWHDYSDVDLVLAHRVASPTLLHEKPASKLVNAWLAGVPAVLSDEPAYAALRRSNLDYSTVDGPKSLLLRIDYLRSHPAVYRAMVDNGLARAREFSATAVRARWMDMLLGDVIPDFLGTPAALPPLLRFAPFAVRLIRQKLEAKVFRRRLAYELHMLHAAQGMGPADAFVRDGAEGARAVPYRRMTA